MAKKKLSFDDWMRSRIDDALGGKWGSNWSYEKVTGKAAYKK